MKQKANCKRCGHLGYKKGDDLYVCWNRCFMSGYTNLRSMCLGFKPKEKVREM